MHDRTPLPLFWLRKESMFSSFDKSTFCQSTFNGLRINGLERFVELFARVQKQVYKRLRNGTTKVYLRGKRGISLV